MERLTDRGYKGRLFMKEPVEDDEKRMVEIIERLAAYEDTGMEPEEIKELSELKTSLTAAEQNMLNDYLGLGSVDRLRELAEADKDGRCVVLPIRVIDAIDKLFSHNEIIALWYDKKEDRDHSYLLWRGEAWRLPHEFGNLALLKFKGIVSGTLGESDTINIQVPPFIRPACESITGEAAEKALEAHSAE